MIKEIVARITEQEFSGDPPLVVGTGGFVHLFYRENIFDHVVSDLILTGLIEVLRLNSPVDRPSR